MGEKTAMLEEVVEVNVGGEIFVTKRSTLLSAEGSVLAAMFSGRWEDSLDRDKDGRIFLDFDPAPFRALLNFLRLRRIREPGKVRWPKLQPEHAEMFNAMVDFLGVQENIDACLDEPLVCAQAGCKDGQVTISGNTISTSSDWHRSVVGTSALANAKAPGDSSVAWRVTLNRLPHDTSRWVFAGVIGEPEPEDGSFQAATSYGWTSLSQVWTAGQLSNSGVRLQEGDNLLFRLDSCQQQLHMAVERTAEILTIQLPKGMAQKARLHLNLHVPGTEVEVSRATASDVAKAGL